MIDSPDNNKTQAAGNEGEEDRGAGNEGDVYRGREMHTGEVIQGQGSEGAMPSAAIYAPSEENRGAGNEEYVSRRREIHAGSVTKGTGNEGYMPTPDDTATGSNGDTNGGQSQESESNTADK